MGGKVWQEKRFKVDAFDHKIGDIDIFSYVNPHNNIHQLHERTTGAFLVEHADLATALQMAKEGIESTPDFAEQMSRFGDPMRFLEVEAASAFRRLAKIKEGES